MPSPLRMVSTRLSSVAPASAPAVTDTAVPTFGPPSLLVASASAVPTHGMLDPKVAHPAPQTSSSVPTATATSLASSPTTMSSRVATQPSLTSLSATPVRPALPPRSSSPTTESSTPPTERSSPSPTPTIVPESVIAAKDAPRAAARPAGLPMSISAGPLTSSKRAVSISAGPLPGRRPRAETLSAGPAPFSKINAKNCPPHIIAIITYLKSHEWGPVWDHCIATYVEIERFAQFQTRGAFLNPTIGRPPEVAAWMKRARKLVDFPIQDVDEFADAWLKWWKSNKPATIEGDVPPNFDWAVLNVTGSNGLLLFIFTLSWWGSAVDDKQGQRGKWLLAVNDVRLVFDRVLVGVAKAYNGNNDVNGGDTDMGLEGSSRYVHCVFDVYVSLI